MRLNEKKFILNSAPIKDIVNFLSENIHEQVNPQIYEEKIQNLGSLLSDKAEMLFFLTKRVVRLNIHLI
ncbi:MAG: hypothetical protein SFT91_03340 [Rickettsiaceae bacterium]|nr:hypothetical protein [Rickettsiaceae bacterium]